MIRNRHAQRNANMSIKESQVRVPLHPTLFFFPSNALLFCKLARICQSTDKEVELTVAPLSNECGTYLTVNARFWPWHSGKSP